MIGIISGILLITLALVALALQRLYSSLPARELKRMAQQEDKLAVALYRPVSYGASLRLLLWLVAALALSGGLLLTMPHAMPEVNFAILAVIFAVCLVILPSLKLSIHAARFAALLAPAVSWVLSFTHGPLDKLAATINRHRELAPHSRLYEKRDLLELLDRQKQQTDNRIAQHELELAERALQFDDKKAADIAQSRKQAHLVNADDAIGPILLDQLHQSGQKSFLVYKDDRDNIIGSLAMHDAVQAKQGGRVFDLIRHDLTFVSEVFSLRQVLTAMQRTGQQLAVVVNNFEEFLGVITLDQLLRELFGDQHDTGLNYSDRSTVAAYKPQPSHEEQPAEQAEREQPSDASTDEPIEEPGVTEAAASSPEATEVIE